MAGVMDELKPCPWLYLDIEDIIDMEGVADMKEGN